MIDNDYKRALDAIYAELGELMRQRIQLDERMSHLKTSAEAISKLTVSPQTPTEEAGGVVEDMGISDAIRHVLKSSQVPLTPSEIKRKLAESGLGDTYVNFSAVIHNTLKRLLKQGEVTRVFDRFNKLTGFTYIPIGSSSERH